MRAVDTGGADEGGRPHAPTAVLGIFGAASGGRAVAVNPGGLQDGSVRVPWSAEGSDRRLRPRLHARPAGALTAASPPCPAPHGSDARRREERNGPPPGEWWDSRSATSALTAHSGVGPSGLPGPRPAHPPGQGGPRMPAEERPRSPKAPQLQRTPARRAGRTPARRAGRRPSFGGRFATIPPPPAEAFVRGGRWSPPESRSFRRRGSSPAGRRADGRRPRCRSAARWAVPPGSGGHTPALGGGRPPRSRGRDRTGRTGPTPRTPRGSEGGPNGRTNVNGSGGGR